MDKESASESLQQAVSDLWFERMMADAAGTRPHSCTVQRRMELLFQQYKAEKNADKK